jgi:putative ribosome biogenesis GTPase RsgA
VQTFDLTSLGWTPELSGAFVSLAAQGLIPGRVGARHRGHIALYTASGEVVGTPSGRLRHAAEATALPVVGDWVAARLTDGQALIEAVLPRRTAFTRAASDLTRRFRDCRHHCEPGCAVGAAAAEGLIAADRLAGYWKLRRELERLERKDSRAATEDRRRRGNVRRAKQRRGEQEGW